MKAKYRYQWYQEIYDNIPKILEEAGRAAKGFGLDKLKDKIGLFPGSSSCPGPLPNYILDAIIKANQVSVLPLRKVEEWQQDYNLNRPHSSLGNISPAEFAIKKRPVEQAIIQPPGINENDLH